MDAKWTSEKTKGLRFRVTPCFIWWSWRELNPRPKFLHVEGAGIFPLIGTDKYILMYDVYMKGKYQFTESTDLENFKVIDNAISMDFHPRHGTVMPITDKELKRLYKAYGKPDKM